ncbi:hypothetical protein J8J14_09140 [Roseomonas sp. SSH11]|uniref:Uncharacterized protein n=1 Tax=Pararoseomonas baculiformis TaxID=2820812 RepID=A0ABS4AD60_9PROT|nr:hypothetical protein [Pararoseomonas baculiformis]MBP0444947.1 hypothetical protein [Pararoseomonas baculiformis]
MITPFRQDARRAGGRPLALLLFMLLAVMPAQGQVVPEPPPLSLAGQTVAALAAHPDVTIVFRSVTRGRQTYILRHLRAAEPGRLSTAEDRYVFGWTCDGGDCAQDGMFLGYDTETERLYLLLLDDGAASLTVPTRGAPWPAPLAEAVLAVKPDLRRFRSE